MFDDLEKQIYVGVIFDLNNVVFEGRWLTEVVKIPLMNIAAKLGISGRVYVGGFENLPKTHGESVYQISTYQEEGSDLIKKLKETFAAVDAQEDAEKFVLIFVNRLETHVASRYKKALKLSELKGHKNKVFFLCFDGHSESLMTNLQKEFGCEYFHIKSSQELENKLNQILLEKK